jgi:hypothetical protein
MGIKRKFKLHDKVIIKGEIKEGIIYRFATPLSYVKHEEDIDYIVQFKDNIRYRYFKEKSLTKKEDIPWE